MRQSRLLFGAVLALPLVGREAGPVAATDGQVVRGVHISLAPTWFAPEEATRLVALERGEVDIGHSVSSEHVTLKGSSRSSEMRPHPMARHRFTRPGGIR